MHQTKRLFCDCETSGLDSQKNSLLQLSGYVEINGIIKREFNFKAAPLPGDSYTPEALKINNLTVEQINAFPPAGVAYKELIAYMTPFVGKFDRADKFMFLAYNAPFDAGFVRSWFKKLGDNYFGSWFFNPPIDIMVLAAHHLEHERHLLPNFKLATVAKHLGIDFNEDHLHDAMFDVELCREVYLRLAPESDAKMENQADD